MKRYKSTKLVSRLDDIKQLIIEVRANRHCFNYMLLKLDTEIIAFRVEKVQLQKMVEGFPKQLRVEKTQ